MFWGGFELEEVQGEKGCDLVRSQPTNISSWILDMNEAGKGYRIESVGLDVYWSVSNGRRKFSSAASVPRCGNHVAIIGRAEL